MTYRVNDVYATLQGEGCQAGVPMALVRLQGCGVGCPWCDTRETWTAPPSHRVGSLEEAAGPGPAWCEAAAETVARRARDLAPAMRWALVTGGEPAEQDLVPLAAALHAEGFRVALETSGTAPGFRGAAIDWFTLSPKVGMPGGRAVLADAVARADEVKWPVGKPADLDALDAFLAEQAPRPETIVCLQPLSTNPRATQLCVETAMRRGWRLSVQAHKFLGLR